MSATHLQHKIHLFSLFFAVALVFVILYLGDVAEIVITAALLAYILEPVVLYLEKKGVSRTASTTLVVLGIILGLLLISMTCLPMAFQQLKSIKSGDMGQSSQILIKLDQAIQEYAPLFGIKNINLDGWISKFQSWLSDKLPEILIHDSGSVLISLIMVPFVMFFILKDNRKFKKYFISLVPNRYFEFTLDLIHKMEVQLGNYLRGQFIDAVAFGIMAVITLWFLDVPYFLIIGAFAGLANLIPFVGPVAGATVAFATVVIQQGELLRACYVLLAFILLKLIDDILVQPLAVGQHVNLHPVVIALAILTGGHLFGILGMLLIIPFLGFIKVVMEEGITTYRKYRFE